jgi:pilus assembly protein CpaE
LGAVHELIAPHFAILCDINEAMNASDALSSRFGGIFFAHHLSARVMFGTVSANLPRSFPMDTWIITESDGLAARVRESLQALAIECPITRIARIDSVGPNADLVADFEGLVFFAARNVDPASIEVLRRIRSAIDQEAMLVVISSVHDHGTVLNAIRAGASDFLAADETLNAEMASFVIRIRSEQRQKHFKSRVVSIVPCHASADASMMAANLSAVIAKRMGSCALLDFHLRGGDLAFLLKLSPRHTLLDLLNQQETIDESMFQQALTPHESGIRLLAGPKSFGDLKNVRAQTCQQIISLAQRSHPLVVINSEDVQHAEQVRALAGSDEIILTMRMDVVSLHRAQQHIDFMTRNRVSHEHIHAVALGVGYAGELPLAAVKKVLQLSSIHCIPDDPVAAIMSINVGNPLVLESPNSKAARALVTFAEALCGFEDDAQAPPDRRSMSAVKAAAIVALNTLPFYK